MGQGPTKAENKMAKKVNKRKEEEKVEEIIEEVNNIAGGSPTSPGKFKNAGSLDTSASPSSNAVKSPSKSKKIPISINSGITTASSMESPLQVKRDSSPRSPLKSMAKRSRSPASPKAKKAKSPPAKMKKDQSPATPTKAKGSKRAASPLPVSPVKAKKIKEDADTKAKKGELGKPATPKSKIVDKEENIKKSKKRSRGEIVAVKGLPNGWSKTSVTRLSGKTAGQVDVYFFAPDGTKLRSRPDVIAYLNKKKLSHKIDIFDFSKKLARVSAKVHPKEKVKVLEKLKKEAILSKIKKGKKEEIKAQAKPKKPKAKEQDMAEDVKDSKKGKAKAKDVDMDPEKDEKRKDDADVNEDLEDEGKATKQLKDAKKGKDKITKRAKEEKLNKKKPKESKKKESSEDNLISLNDQSSIAENGDGNPSGPDEEKKDVLEKGSKVIVQVKDAKKKRLRK